MVKSGIIWLVVVVENCWWYCLPVTVLLPSLTLQSKRRSGVCTAHPLPFPSIISLT
jgi:hypothetical protein